MSIGTRLLSRRLVVRQADEGARLRKLLEAAARMPPEIGGTIAISRPPNWRPYVATVFPLPQPGASLLPGAALVAVFIADPHVSPGLPVATLMNLYHLTRAKAAMASRIAAGMNLKQAAGDLRIAPTTARLHLQRVMAKTGAHRQGDLIRLLLLGIQP